MKFGFTLVTLIAMTLFSSTGCNILRRGCNDCNSCNAPIGCRPCSIGWQRGGTDYGHHLGSKSHPQPGEPSGVQAPTTAYPYYTVRGPRDFLSCNPPSIGR